MSTHIGALLFHRKWILVVSIPVLIAAWWAFRPEKLWINQKVSEAAPFALSSNPQPLYTGRFEGKAHPTSGRATIYGGAGGMQYVRLTDFTTSNGPDVHVVLARSDDKALSQNIVTGQFDNVELGVLKGNQGDQNYYLPASLDLKKYNVVVVYCERFHAIFGIGRLEPF
jgi:hypothetical protein